MDSKSYEIIAQNAAYQASSLTAIAQVPTEGDYNENLLAVWKQIHSTVFAALLDEINSVSVPAAVTQIAKAFPGSQEVTPITAAPSYGGGVALRGDVLGAAPDWLIAACAKDGVTEVWDNRKEAQGTRKPWFKQVTSKDNAESAKAYWPPKGVVA